MQHSHSNLQHCFDCSFIKNGNNETIRKLTEVVIALNTFEWSSFEYFEDIVKTDVSDLEHINMTELYLRVSLSRIVLKGWIFRYSMHRLAIAVKNCLSNPVGGEASTFNVVEKTVYLLGKDQSMESATHLILFSMRMDPLDM